MIDKPTVRDRPVKKQIPPLFNNRSNRNMRQAQKKTYSAASHAEIQTQENMANGRQ